MNALLGMNRMVHLTNLLNKPSRRIIYCRVTDKLHRMNSLVNHKKVLVLMREIQLLSTAFNRRTRKYNSYRWNVGIVTKNLVNCCFFTDQKLVTDV